MTVINMLTIRLSMSTRSPATWTPQISTTIASLKDYSNNCNLTLSLNPAKTNWMLISTPEVARYHSLEERDLPIVCWDSALNRIYCTKLGSTPLMEHTREFPIKFVIRDPICSANAQKPCTLPRQETSCREPSSLTPELCLHGISSLACLSRKASPTSTGYICWLCHKKICRATS